MAYFQFEKIIYVFIAVINISIPSLAKTNVEDKSLYINSSNEDHKVFLLNKQNRYYLKSLISSNDYLDNSVQRETFTSNSELEIESNEQSEKGTKLYAEGDVIIKFKGNTLNADRLIYDKSNKVIIANGNIRIKIKDQIFQADKIEYDFLNEKGILLNVKGLINTDNLIYDIDFQSADLDSDSSLTDVDSNSSLIIQEIKKNKVLYTPNKISNWIFFTDKIIINANKWSAEKAIFTNDLLDSNQIKLVLNSLDVFSSEDKLIFKSKLSYLVSDEKLSLPFWLGEKTLAKNDNVIPIENQWTLGFDNLEKDGFFIGRKFKPTSLTDDLTLNLEPQYLLQRATKGYSKSFVQKDSSLISDRVKRDTSLSDYFALDSLVEGELKNWKLKIDTKINSFDLQKFSNALRIKSELSEEIELFNLPFVNRFYAVYRDRIWNGSLGETEVYGGYGWKFDHKSYWKNDNIENNQNIAFGFAEFRAEDLDSDELNKSIKGAFFYELDQKIPIFRIISNDKYIDISYKYVPEPINQGLFLNTKISALYNQYEYANHQEYIGFGLGPEFIIGNFKRDYFDYSRLNILPFYKFKSGNSVFKFDQISEKFTVEIAYDQHIFNSLLIKTSGKLNLDSESNNYGEFIDSKIALNWKRRSYQVGFFYQPHNQAGGINFSLFGFE